MDDLVNNPDHGSIRTIDSSEFTTLGSIIQRTYREHAEEEVDQLWVDYITRLPVDARYHRLDLTTARNESIADYKRLAMSFDSGRGLPVASPVQINREGLKYGKESGGKITFAHLAQFNAIERESDIVLYIYYGEDESATSEPKVGILKSRYSKINRDPVPLYLEPDSRRIADMSGGLPTTTAGGGGTAADVEL
jgi:hypothetical protein